MKVLWITYTALGRAAKLLENRFTQSGTWIDATAMAIIQDAKVQLTIASICSNDEIITVKENGIEYIGVSGVKRKFGCAPKAKDIAVWKEIITKKKPDVIMVWGTEYSNGLSIIDAAGNIPVLFFIQGVIGKITDYRFGNLPMFEAIKMIGLVNAVKFLHNAKNYHLQAAQKKYEEKMIRKSHGIITDNEWANSYYSIVAPHTRCYFYPLPVNSIFMSSDRDKIETNTILTVDGCNPAKGVFHLIKALALVKREIPNVKLYIPGRIPTGTPRLLKEAPYYTYLKKLITSLELDDNVVFLGQLTQLQLKSYLEKCRIFVMPSAIENHSSSLREAMYMGVPCVSAEVGSVTEFAHNGVNALTYRYEEEDVLAAKIIYLLKNLEIAEKIAEKGKQTVKKLFPQDRLGKMITEIYKEVISQ